ncbi:hypothetical protein [Paraburkholderia hospita]|jgi:hypothetical protein|uniref:hypothetical protein n=1 Tax=Paraburkholderia TaxID=1822464 RepID=UPI0012601F55
MNAFYLGCILTAISANGRAYAHSFEGSWNWSVAPSTRTFSIELNAHGNVLKGQYCAVAENGNRTDCDDERNTNIDGVIDRTGQSATVHFSSFFGAKNGKARIAIQNDHLLWHITKNPDDGEFYAPSDAVLDRH